MYTVFALYSCDLLPSFPTMSPPPTGTNFFPQQDLFCPPVPNFVEEKKGKKLHFCLFEIKVATQEVSLWHFHVYMDHNPNWFISSIFLHSTVIPFL
jgi:hypothetical protein